MIFDIKYIAELKEQITNPDKWNKNQFIAFNYEAGTGKTTLAQRILGEMKYDSSNKVLYVQRFSKDDQLKKTVDAINSFTGGRKVAYSFESGNNRKEQRRLKKLIPIYEVLCITHNMYIQICKGEHKELIQNRSILIIDEYPDFLRMVPISSSEISDLWYMSKKIGLGIEEMATLLRDLNDQHGKPMWFNYLKLDNSAYEKYRKSIKSALTKIDDKEMLKVLQKCQHLFNNGGFLHEGGFLSFDEKHQMVMLKNNIILDANAGFDYRYALSDKFVVNHQKKVFEYDNQTFHHFDVKTTKTALKNDVNFERDALLKISLEGKKAVLFVTQQSSVENVRTAIVNHFLKHGNSIEEIERNLNCKIKIDYFGHIIGVNTYRDFDMVVLLKTPNYEYSAYAMTYFYYKLLDSKPIEDVLMYEHAEVENIRKTVIAGEMYQAIKRINRDNSQHTDIYIFSDSQDVIDLVLKELPKIKYLKKEMGEEKKNKGKERVEKIENTKSSKVKAMLIETKEAGIPSISKKELREKLEIHDAPYFGRMLKSSSMELFLNSNNMINKGQKIIFLDNLDEDGDMFVSA
ncbi:DEAD/DEAH box helicase family protein [Paenibacillus sp. JTLBN-2024]